MTVRDPAPAAPPTGPVKEEPGEVPAKEGDASTAPPPAPPSDVTLKREVKEEPEEERGDGKDEDGEGEGPCTKMTMRLRRNINNPQFVSSRRLQHPSLHLHCSLQSHGGN